MQVEVIRKPGMKLQLWIRDLGAFDPYRAFMDGVQLGPYFEVEKHIAIPEDMTVVMAQFDGDDGGASAIVDASVDPPARLAVQDEGFTHTYKITDAP
jgi:hypothetical protein